jgi:hypothetical protein
VTQVATFSQYQFRQTVENEFSFAQIARCASQWQPWNTSNVRGYAVLKVGRLVSGKEQPRSGSDALSICEFRLPNSHGRYWFDVGHAHPSPTKRKNGTKLRRAKT